MKRKFFAMFTILFIPFLALVGCGETKTFSVTTNSSNEDLGTGSGGSLDLFNEKSKVTLKATELKGNTNPFLCWIKDRSRVVSSDKEYQITVREATAGEYTAVFQETHAQSMRFATLNKISYVGTESFTNFSYTVTYELANQPITLCEGEIGQNEMNVFDGNVFDLSSDANLSFTIHINASNSVAEISYPDYVVKNLTNSTFDGQNVWICSTEDGNFTFEFAKLNSTLFVD